MFCLLLQKKFGSLSFCFILGLRAYRSYGPKNITPPQPKKKRVSPSRARWNEKRRRFLAAKYNKFTPVVRSGGEKPGFRPKPPVAVSVKTVQKKRSKILPPRRLTAYFMARTKLVLGSKKDVKRLLDSLVVSKKQRALLSLIYKQGGPWYLKSALRELVFLRKVAVSSGSYKKLYQRRYLQSRLFQRFRSYDFRAVLRKDPVGVSSRMLGFYKQLLSKPNWLRGGFGRRASVYYPEFLNEATNLLDAKNKVSAGGRRGVLTRKKL